MIHNRYPGYEPRAVGKRERGKLSTLQNSTPPYGKILITRYLSKQIMLFLTLYLEIVYHLWLGRYGSRSTDELAGESGSQFPALIWKLSLPHRSRFIPGVPITLFITD